MAQHRCNCRCIMPPAPELEEKIIKTKKAIEEIHTSGREMKSFKETKGQLSLDDYLTIANRPSKTFPDTLVSPTKEFAPVTGVKKTIVLLVDFSDKPATQPKSRYQDLLFSVGSFSTGSMRDYFREVSYNKLDVQGEVHGWFRAPNPKSYYTNNDNGFGSYPRNAQKLAEDVIDLANSSVNFSQFDNDGDNLIEAVVIIAAGSGGEQTGNKSDIWSHKWNISPKTVDGKKIDRYFMAPEDGRVGVMSHELGHLLLSWPDLYDIDYSSRGTGAWDLMAGGSWNNGGNTPAHPTAWCKLKAGWVNPVVITNAQQNVTIPPYSNNGIVYKLPVNSKEYFLLANRQKTGFDSNLPGEGLLITHIDDNQSNNTDENHYLVDVEQCDGQRHLNSNANSGDSNDTFPSSSNNKFDSSSNPSSKTYSNSDSKISVTNIQRSGNNITATIKAGDPGPQWQNGKKIVRTYTSSHSKNAYAIVNGINGWKKIEELTEDGVTNVFITACEAQAGNRSVDVFMDETSIQRIIMK